MARARLSERPGGTEGVSGRIRQISAVATALAEDRVSCWGDGSFNGQLGGGTTQVSAAPVLVEGVERATSIAVGDTHACAVVTDGQVRCWGARGPLLGAHPTMPSVVSAEGLVSPLAIAAGEYHTCAIESDGRVVCWGAEPTTVMSDE